MRGLALLLALFIAAPASAETKALILNDEEQKVLIQMLDAAVKGAGLPMAGNADYIYRKIQNAPAAPPEPVKTEKPNG